jgi:hypothetical protein
MSSLLVDALIALKFADEMIGGEPYEHVSQEAADAHYHLRETITNIEKHLQLPAYEDATDVIQFEAGC